MSTKITVKMEGLSKALDKMLRDAGEKNRIYLMAELRALPYNAQRAIPETYRDSGLNVITGALVGSNYPIPLIDSGNEFRVGLRNPMQYAAIHEFGGTTWRGGHIRERSFIRPALEKAYDAFANKVMGREGFGL